jgi:hypothetical protein
MRFPSWPEGECNIFIKDLIKIMSDSYQLTCNPILL